MKNKNWERLVALALIGPFAILLAGCMGNGQSDAEIVHQHDNLTAAESVLYDADNKQFYVSLVNQMGYEADGALALVGADGALKTTEFVKGLYDPHGMAVHGGKLYVADRSDLVQIDIASQTIEKKYYAAGSLYLNDVAASDDGAIFVSDVLANKIYRLSPGGALEVWMEGPELNQPNGMQIKDGAIYLVSWGLAKEPTIDGLMAVTNAGKLVKINLSDKAVTPLASELGNMDGLIFDEKGNLFASDWRSGDIFYFKPDGSLIKRYSMKDILGEDSAQGTADIGYDPQTKLVWAPLMMKGRLVALKFKE